ncbi:MAG: fasciclin domain-containing protein [Bacteroidales bacterium]|nr:fasciclin domain-containing protein [Bacteroidales bacterium]
MLSLLGLLLLSCDPELKREDKYARPDWLAGKVYTQLLDQPDLSTFAKCVELSGYDTIIDRSGSYTVFAPNNEAFSLYFQNHPAHNNVEDIPVAELRKLVKYHLVQNPWTKTQLRTLDVYGWIDTLDLNNNKPRGFKRQTLLLDDNRKLGIMLNNDQTIKIVDTLETTWHRVVATDSRKYAPIFFREYFDIYDLSADDYSFYFDRTLDDPQDLYFAGGRVIGDEIFAENGFVYEIDRVTDPLSNVYQILEDKEGPESYTEFLDLVNLFPNFEYNEEKTYDQPGADQGLEVDSLFDMSYTDLVFDILNERTSPPSGTFGLPNNVTIRYHHGIIAPTNTAFDEFLNEYFVGPGRWGTLEGAPDNIKRIIVNTHMSPNTIYPTDFENGFSNGEQDRITLDAGDIVEKQFGSNSTFIGVDNMVVPRLFYTVAGPAYLLKGYSKTMFSIEDAGLLSALKREDDQYLFYIESNVNSSTDSSLLYESSTEQFSLFQIAQGEGREYMLGNNALRTLLMNHIAIGTPSGMARKEYFKNLVGNFIIINNETGEVRGTAPTSIGYQGLVQQPNFPTEITIEADNGITYDIENYFSFSAPNIYLKIQGNYPVFYDLLIQAGLANAFEITFLSANEDYTVFIPSDSALIASRVDTLDREALQSLLKFHFVQGDLIFTDGVKPALYYETSRIDDKSTTFTTIYSKMYIDPGYDLITIGDAEGGSYLGVKESDASNIVTGRDLGEGNEVFRNLVINGVIHEIDKVLIFDEVDTE